MSALTNLHFANIWEHVSDIIPDRLAVICGNDKKNWQQYEQDAAKIASFLNKQGIKEDSKVGLYLHNSNEYLEAQFATFKVMGVPVNVNYRYKSNELIYLLDNSDSEAVFFEACYADQVNEIASSLPNIKTWIQVGESNKKNLSYVFKYDEILKKSSPRERMHRSEENP